MMLACARGSGLRDNHPSQRNISKLRSLSLGLGRSTGWNREIQPIGSENFRGTPNA